MLLEVHEPSGCPDHDLPTCKLMIGDCGIVLNGHAAPTCACVIVPYTVPSTSQVTASAVHSAAKTWYCPSAQVPPVAAFSTPGPKSVPPPPSICRWPYAVPAEFLVSITSISPPSGQPPGAAS